MTEIANGPAKTKNLPHSTNVGKHERWLSGIAGGALTLLGLRRRGILGLATAAVGGSLIYRATTGYCSVYNALGINRATAAEHEKVWERGIKIEKSISIRREPQELYHFWRNLANLPQFMQHVKEVRCVGDKLSYWIVEAPAGKTVEWAAEIINDVPGELIAWRSLPGADVVSAGTVLFTRQSDGNTQVTLELQYRPPAGKIGAGLARLFGKAPEQQIDEDLARFCAIMEAHQEVG
ncbi:MAG TPA: SRPBCC family protein [Planctomycetota bacterium]|jgi:uncharacterized membrane protein